MAGEKEIQTSGMTFKRLDLTRAVGESVGDSCYDVYIDDTRQVIYKKTKENSRLKLCKEDFLEYKNTILDVHGKNFRAIRGFDVEDDGSYKCKYVDGFTLYQIRFEWNENDDIIKEKPNIINAFEDFKSELFQKKIRSGEHDLKNLIYSLSDKKIYNVDLEGYFSLKEGMNVDMERYPPTGWLDLIRVLYSDGSPDLNHQGVK